MSLVTSFRPQIASSTEILILGSMPGVQSLQQQQYYANPKNQFWRILYTIFATPLDQDYEQRLAFMASKGIGLWDVLESCTRCGSLDSNIRNEKVNNFTELFKRQPNIKYVLFNGAKAYETFRKGVGFAQFSTVRFINLPSTSPANTQSFEHKLQAWSIISQLHSGKLFDNQS